MQIEINFRGIFDSIFKKKYFVIGVRSDSPGEKYKSI